MIIQENSFIFPIYISCTHFCMSFQNAYTFYLNINNCVYCLTNKQKMWQKYLKRLPFYQAYHKKRIEQQSQFYVQNRINVLDTYRFLLKNIPKIYPRPLQQHQKINEVRWIYKTGKALPSIEETEGRTKLAIQVVEDIKKGDLTRLGDFVPRYNQREAEEMETFFEDKLPKKPKWWRGHIY